jgi:cellulose biosynthesis protein BcsQ
LVLRQRKDLRVLLVNLDPQFNLSQYVTERSGIHVTSTRRRPRVLDILEQATSSSGTEIDPEDEAASILSRRPAQPLVHTQEPDGEGVSA